MQVILDDRAEFGRASTFEDWTKLDIILQKGGSNASDIQWLFEMLHEVRTSKVRVVPHSSVELSRKNGDLYKWLLYRKFLDGMKKDFLSPVLEALRNANRDKAFDNQVSACLSAYACFESVRSLATRPLPKARKFHGCTFCRLSLPQTSCRLPSG